MTSCAAFGSHVAITLPPPVVPFPYQLGLAEGSGVASSSGRKRHSPSGPLNVGTPLAADTPAPVSTVNRVALAVSRRQWRQVCRHRRQI